MARSATIPAEIRADSLAENRKRSAGIRPDTPPDSVSKATIGNGRSAGSCSRGFFNNLVNPPAVFGIRSQAITFADVINDCHVVVSRSRTQPLSSVLSSLNQLYGHPLPLRPYEVSYHQQVSAGTR